MKYREFKGICFKTYMVGPFEMFAVTLVLYVYMWTHYFPKWHIFNQFGHTPEFKKLAKTQLDTTRDQSTYCSFRIQSQFPMATEVSPHVRTFVPEAIWALWLSLRQGGECLIRAISIVRSAGVLVWASVDHRATRW